MKSIPRAIKDGEIDLKFVKIPCAILKDGTRLLTISGITKSLGKANAKGGKSALSAEIPPFLNILVLKPFITKELISSTRPIEFQMENGAKAFGYRAESLPMICDVFLKARDAGVLNDKQMTHAASADLLIRGMAHIGIISLVDEACDYQEFRDKSALQAILEQYLSKEAAKWAKTFQDEFYLGIFRLNKWNVPKQLKNKPGCVASITNDLVYERLAPGLLEALEEKNPIQENGRRKFRHHQIISKEVGLNHLKGHLFMLQKLMKSSSEWEDFMKKVNEYLPYPTIEEVKIEEI